jgi:heat-inducible transcriptional repressor
MLTERREQLLQYIIDEYVGTAQPVGSGALVKKYNLQLSSATVRNEMAKLEDEGYIGQPHTSAGRVPTARGYRYYVEALMREQIVPDDLKQTIRHQFHQAALELEEWARLAAAIMASSLHNAAVVTTPHSLQPRLRLMEIVGVHDSLALVVVVLQEARVLQQTLTLERPLTQEELTDIARKLNDLLAAKSAAEIRQTRPLIEEFEAPFVDAAADLIESAEGHDTEPSYMEGLRDLLSQPEFIDGGRALEIMEAFDGRKIGRSIPAGDRPEPARPGEVTILIGDEHPLDAMRICSVISTPYAGPSGLRGTLSVVGPTRMHYSRAVPMVRYMSALMEELLDVYFA